MSVEINIKHNLKQVSSKLHSFEKKALKRATIRSLNKTGTTINKEAATRIKRRTALPVRRIKSKMRIRKAGRNRFTWSITGLRATTNLIEWVTPSKQMPGAFRKQKGVRSRAWGKPKVYRGTFIGRGKNSGKLLVYSRTGKGRYPIEAKHGPSIRSAFFKELKALEVVARSRFNVVLEQEIIYEIRKTLSR